MKAGLEKIDKLHKALLEEPNGHYDYRLNINIEPNGYRYKRLANELFQLVEELQNDFTLIDYLPDRMHLFHTIDKEVNLVEAVQQTISGKCKVSNKAKQNLVDCMCDANDHINRDCYALFNYIDELRLEEANQNREL